MRHFVIGKINTESDVATLEMFNGALKSEGTESEIKKQAFDELAKFVDYAQEGAAIRVETNEGVYFHQRDIENGNPVEFESTLNEFKEVHWFYEGKFDFSGKSIEKIKRKRKEEKLRKGEYESSLEIKEFPEEKINEHVKKIVVEMETFIQEYVKNEL